MTIIDEIEAAAKRWDATLPQAYDCDEWHAQGIVEAPQWRRIRAALLAAQELESMSVPKDGMVMAYMITRKEFHEAFGS